jgi:hypothetical protein
MDPNEVLRNLREEINRDGGSLLDDAERLEAIMQLFTELDGWLAVSCRKTGHHGASPRASVTS